MASKNMEAANWRPGFKLKLTASKIIMTVKDRTRESGGKRAELRENFLLDFKSSFNAYERIYSDEGGVIVKEELKLMYGLATEKRLEANTSFIT